ncbi:MBOAT family O-acyltransferase [Clostridium paraputrificum]|uniref:MBOAT family O-acyltransferase n=1 Tax=Clostridium paraputrificum TaxID=29363 RepID=UPI000411E711|nr:MBOAT family O-acyltransferase [Clostridium paraputrificum]
MSFNSYEFLIFFLPISLIGYYGLHKLNNKKSLVFWLCLASLFFYGANNPKVILIFFLSIITNYIFTKVILSKNNTSLTKSFLILGITLNILFLCFFKYFNFKNIVFPLGISFITFQQISLLYDSYKRNVNDFSFLNYLFYITFFPKVISGPLVNYNSLTEELDKSSKSEVNYASISKGIFLFSIGLFKKVIIADTIALIVTNGFDLSSNLNFLEGWITALSYTLQIYFDFSGYSDMAIGIAALFNINLPMNFNTPYKSRSIKEFWQRWHIALGTFFTRYLYIPLGGNRKGQARTYLNLFIIFLISGIWHGTGLGFIIWGILHGIARVINQIFIDKKIHVNKYLSIFITFNFVNIAWVFFRATDLKSAFKVLKAMFDFSFIPEILPLFKDNFKVITTILIIAVLLVTLSKINKLNKINNKLIIKISLSILIILFGADFFINGNFNFLKDALANLDFGSDFVMALKIAIIGFILICVDFKNIISTEDFNPTFVNLVLASLLTFISTLNFDKVSDFIYKSF